MAGGAPGSWGNWADVPAGVKSTIEDLLHTWEQQAGFSEQGIPDWARLEMANQNLTSNFEVANYMWHHMRFDQSWNPGAYFVPGSVGSKPGLQWGLAPDQFFTKLTQYQNFMQQYTGTGGNWDDFASLMTSNEGQWDVGTATERLLHDPNALKTYGWLKYGLTYDTFQQQKVQMRQNFGFELDDKQAVAQLQYNHAATSAQFAAASFPTLSQAEKKSANVGLTGAGAAIR